MEPARSMADFFCEELCQYLFTFLSPNSLATAACISYQWRERVQVYKHFIYQKWQTTYIGLGGNPNFVNGKNNKNMCWGEELCILQSCVSSPARLFHYATQKGDLALIKSLLLLNNNLITTTDVAGPTELDGCLFEWRYTNRKWVACRCILKDRFVFIFDGDKLVKAIEVDKEVEVQEVMFRPGVLFLLKTPQTIYNFRAPTHCDSQQWIKMISLAKATV